MADNNNKKHVVVVGGGLVGALIACYFSKRGYKVDLYELREDIRDQSVVQGRSINLALSCRGREALRAVGLEDEMLASGIPMHARMIHDTDGARRPILYGQKHQFIMSIDRRYLNELLLSAAEKRPGVNLHFEHKLLRCDFEKGEALFQTVDGREVSVEADLLVGCDGAYSALRRQVMRNTRFNFKQEYITHGYMELRIPPNEDGKFSMEINYLHIWPRNEYMMIGLPNVNDQSFVLTLFMPFAMFDTLKTDQQVLDFFNDKFPDSVELIGKESLMNAFRTRKPLPLVTVKCSPYHVNDKAVLLGDAAHAMVPFYGQGMNCGFEDCLVFDGILEQFNDDFAKALPEYTRVRNPDAEAMCDLALYNYVEMRESVNSRMFILRKHLDNFLHWLLPNTWIPLYTTVSFTRTRYHICIENRKWQDKVLRRLVLGAGVLALAGVAVTTRQLLSGQGAPLVSALRDTATRTLPGWLAARLS